MQTLLPHMTPQRRMAPCSYFPQLAQVPLPLSVKNNAVKQAISDTIKLRGYKHPVDAHLTILRKIEIAGGVGGLYLCDQHGGLRGALPPLAHDAGGEASVLHQLRVQICAVPNLAKRR